MTNNQIEEIVIKLYKEIHMVKDPVLQMLYILKAVPRENIDDVIKMYELVKDEEVMIVTVYSRVELKDEQKNKIKEKLSKEFKNKLIFDFIKDDNLDSGLRIEVKDKTMDFSL